MRQTFAKAARLGLTGVHNMAGAGAGPPLPRLRPGGGAATAGLVRGDRRRQPPGEFVGELAAARRNAAEALAAVTEARGPTFEVGYAKLMADGVLSARTAALLEPYSDAAGESGFLVTEPDALTDAVERINTAGFPAAIHAIGDRAVRISLDAFEAARERGAEAALPNRIEHIEALHPADAPRFRELGVLASFNPHHCITGIGIYNTDRLGPARAAESFAWGSARDAGASLVFGSDWSTAPARPPPPALRGDRPRKTGRGAAGRLASPATGRLSGGARRLHARAGPRLRLGTARSARSRWANGRTSWS